MDNEDLEIQTPEPIIKPKRAPKLKVENSAAKPSVEGINIVKPAEAEPAKPSPTLNPLLTPEEKTLVLEADLEPDRPATKTSSGKLMPQTVINRVNKKPSNLKALLVILVILIILGGAGYEGYNWWLKQQEQPATNQATTTLPNSTNALPSSTQTSGLPVSTSTTSTTATSATTSVATVATSTQPTATLELTVSPTPTGFLNVRTTPSLAGTIITKVHPGEIYPYTQVKNGWYEITLTDGTQGWVSGQYITKNK